MGISNCLACGFTFFLVKFSQTDETIAQEICQKKSQQRVKGLISAEIVPLHVLPPSPLE